MGIERRIYPRIRTLELVSYENYETTKTELMQGMGKTIDLSFGGICIQTSHALPLGSQIKLTITLDDNLVEAEGKIVSLNLTEDLNVMIHVQFSNLAPKSRQIISDFLEKTESGAGKDRADEVAAQEAADKTAAEKEKPEEQ